MRIDRSTGSHRGLDRLVGDLASGPEPMESETEFEVLADAVEDCAMFLLDEAGHVRTWNTGGERVQGYASDGILGEHVSVLYRDEDVEAGVPDRHLREAAAGGHVREEGWRVREDGSEFRADVVLTALRDGGDLVGYASVVRDRTRRRREQALLERTERLEDLIATISHDLRSPLAVAEGNVELALETGDLSRLEATTRALERTTELLDYLTRLAEEDGRIADPEPVDLHEVAVDAWRSVETEGAAFEVEGRATFGADRQRLQQLLENLLGNAVEHGARRASARDARGDAVEHGSTSSPPGADDAVERAGPDVTVRVGPLEGEAGRFFVEDDGLGIPEADRTAVFETGYSTDAEGTGFGLAICERIAEAHGWSIDVTDGTDGGARFEVSVDDRK